MPWFIPRNNANAVFAPNILSKLYSGRKKRYAFYEEGKQMYPYISLLKGAKFSDPILNAWLELKTNGWP